MFSYSVISLVLFAAFLPESSMDLPYDREPDEPGIEIKWHWEDNFSSEEKMKIKNWLNSVSSAVEFTLGTYPFDLHFHIYNRGDSREPVPWANTIRHSDQGVNFHIDPSHTLESFLKDWTAPHEISHLSLPFLGTENAWFAEGYASFLQYQVMEELGIYSAAEVEARYKDKMAMAIPYYQGDQDMVSMAKSLRKGHRYPQMYWGSASFFIRLDQELQKDYGLRLTELIKKYQGCCRMDDQSIGDVIASWDRLLEGNACSELMKMFQTAPASANWLQ